MLGFVAGYLIGWAADSQLQKISPGPLRILAYIATWVVLYMTLFLLMAVVLELNGMSSSGPAAVSMAAGMTAALIVLSTSHRRDRRFNAANEEQADPNVKTGLDKALDEEPDDEEWELLRRFDTEVRDAIEIIQPYGAEAILELRKAFRAIGDKNQLRRIANEMKVSYEEEAKKFRTEKSL